jgi:tetratricopeptide (TPR) repeat protein
MRKAPAILDPTVIDPIQLEALALFQVRNKQFIQRLEKSPPLTITPRLAWFMYKSGQIEHATAYLTQCPDDDILANWLRFRIAQRNGESALAIEYLETWLADQQNDPRVLYEFDGYSQVSPNSASYGNLGSLFVSQGDMQEALISFIKAGAYQDAALIGERYLKTERLQQIVDTFTTKPIDLPENNFYKEYRLENPKEYIERQLAYLLARRLVRENRPQEAMPYYPPSIAKILKTYLNALAKSENRSTAPDIRSAHLFHAARLLRNNGMKLRGTELGPDYRIVNGHYSSCGVNDRIDPLTSPPIYAETAPTPDLRFHYKHLAAELAGKAADLTQNRHQKAVILWTAGSWIQNKYPQEADIYYKKLASIRQQPLAAAADIKRWFPKASRAINEIYSTDAYIPPKTLSEAAREYK